MRRGPFWAAAFFMLTRIRGLPRRIRRAKFCQEDYFTRSPFDRLESGIVET